MCLALKGSISASSTGFPKAKWELGNSRARETSRERQLSEKRERRMMGTSVECERRVLGRKRREKEKPLRLLPLPSLPSCPLSLMVNPNIPSDRELLVTKQVLFFYFSRHPVHKKTTWFTFLLAKLWLANHFIRYSNVT